MRALLADPRTGMRTAYDRLEGTLGLLDHSDDLGRNAGEGDFVRQPDGGLKALTASDPGLLDALPVLPSERGDPMSPLPWTLHEPVPSGGEADDARPPN
ncbi:MAG: hypothetical protein ACRYHQ_34650 [Janthinobacterium lividum]